MNYRMIARVLGWILLIYAALLLLPLAAGLWYGERVWNFVLTIALSAALGGLLMLPRPRNTGLSSPEASPALWMPCLRRPRAFPPPALQS